LKTSIAVQLRVACTAGGVIESDARNNGNLYASFKYEEHRELSKNCPHNPSIFIMRLTAMLHKITKQTIFPRKHHFLILFKLSATILTIFASVTWAGAQPPVQINTIGKGPDVPILLYHRLGPVVADSMTMTTAVFESHLKYLRDNGYKVIPLRELVDYYLKKGPAPAQKSVVIVEDDAHISVYRYMLPLVKKYNVPVTVFIYPSAISNASYAMTWEQLRELKKTGLFDFQSHTYWHPNFKHDKKRMKPAEFDKFVDSQLKKSKEKIEKELGGNVDLLAWPFGICDDYLIKKAASMGYRATFTIARRQAGPVDDPMKLPRFLLSNSDQGKAFVSILEGNRPGKEIVRTASTKRENTHVRRQ
jgi:peptidoglycan/xylan/chitin deacetylase (PgdA/CDA1 family)